MPVSVFWDDESKTIVRYVFDGRWTWEEFFAAKAEAMCLIDTVPHQVGVIMDIAFLPSNWLIQGRKALRNKHPRTAVVVIVATKPVLRTMLTSLKGISPLGAFKVDLAANLDEARHMVATRLDTTTEPI